MSAYARGPPPPDVDAISMARPSLLVKLNRFSIFEIFVIFSKTRRSDDACIYDRADGLRENRMGRRSESGLAADDLVESHLFLTHF